MNKLFVFYVGGSAPSSLIELHDVRFGVGETMEDTYDDLKASWWGTPDSLHLDCWGELTSADGHNVVLKTEPPAEDADKLWFVNLGGYDPGQFEELHKNVFVVAPNKSKAKVRALKTILDWKGHHKDGLFQIEHIHGVAGVAEKKGLYIHLEKTDAPVPFAFACGYKPIGKGRAA